MDLYDGDMIARQYLNDGVEIMVTDAHIKVSLEIAETSQDITCDGRELRIRARNGVWTYAIDSKDIAGGWWCCSFLRWEANWEV
jgi:hypothetical protein